MSQVPQCPRWTQTPKFAKALLFIAGSMTTPQLRRSVRECGWMTQGNVDFLSYQLRDVIADQCRREISRRDGRRKQALLFPI